MGARDVVEEWHEVVRTGDSERLQRLLADDCSFHSPVVFTPQDGRARTALYLAAALEVFDGADFAYVGELVGDDRAVLEFTADLDGTHVHGVDIIDVEDDRIVRFTVMVRPLQGIDALHRAMASQLGAAPPAARPT
jgi:hypothetical protein